MRPPLGLTEVHRQDRLRALEGLDLRFLVEGEHCGVRGRIHVQAHHIPHLLDQLRVGRDLERFGDVRFEAKRAPDAADGRMAHPRVRGHGSRTPMRFADRRLFERFHDHRFDILVHDRARCSNPGLVVDAVEAAVNEPLAPFANGRIGGAIASRDRRIRRAVGARQHEPRAERQQSIRAWPLRQPDQRAAFILRDNQRRFGASCDWHAPLDHNADSFAN